MFKRVEFEPQAAGPLLGVKVLDLSRLVAGNTLTMVLADLGADVLKVEPPSGDTLRHWKVAGVSTAWKAYSRNKKSLCLDFHHTEAHTILLDLAANSTVLVESFRPGTLEKMGLAPAVLLARNPRLVIARISGWGQSGPYRDRPGFGTLVEGMSGFASMNGFADREPVLPPIYLGDMVAGLYGAMGVLAALRHVEVGAGAGQVIDMPLLDPLFAILGPQAANYRLTRQVKPRTGSRSTNSAPRNVYPTADGKWVCLSASTQGMAERLFEAIGRPDLANGDRFRDNTARLCNVEALDAIIREFIAKKSQADCVAYFAERAVTVGPVYDMADIGEDAHFQERDIVVELPDEEMGSIPVHTISPRFGLTPGNFHAAAPALGEHTREALRGAGYGDEKITALERAGAVKAGEQG
ncbi:MAG TPA: CoA transferase [Acidobacteriaceae bacterium]|jgi:crotonobetainyl-CoA:carnitine CoA-transferase CaiB-like acyl-CoA transferase|nr:CoA transferase [Acidobacteriaceae bacterium]